VSDPDDILADPTTGEVLGSAPAQRKKRRPYYPTVAAFVEGYLAEVYARPVDAANARFCWCPTWWEHPEAVARLEALWKAWEKLRRDPGTGMSVWWNNHCDPTMATLTSSDGPFRQCPHGHRKPPPLPVEAAPDWLQHNVT
jgi:hypothetical protein